MAGFWNGIPSGEAFNGPLAGDRVKIIARSTVTKREIYREAYQHPSIFTPNQDFEVCVQLTPPGDNGVTIRSTDSLKVSVKAGEQYPNLWKTLPAAFHLEKRHTVAILLG